MSDFFKWATWATYHSSSGLVYTCFGLLISTSFIALLFLAGFLVAWGFWYIVALFWVGIPALILASEYRKYKRGQK